MKKLLFLIIIVGAIGGGAYFVVVGNAQRLNQMVANLEKFDPPKDPYASTTKKKFKKNDGTIITRDVTEPWNWEHDETGDVKACWSRRKEGTLPLVIEMVKDTSKPAKQRIAGLLVIGFANRMPNASRTQQVELLVSNLANTGDRIAEFAAFALGRFAAGSKKARKEVDDAVSAFAGKASDDARYYALCALRDARHALDENAAFSKEAGAAILAGLEDKNDATRKLAASEAYWVRGDPKETQALLSRLLALLKDKDQSISDAARDSIQRKLTELPAGSDEHKAIAAEAKKIYDSPQEYTKANAVWVVSFVNDEASQYDMGAPLPLDRELYAVAWANDLDKNLVKAAVAYGYGRHGQLEHQVKACNFLLEDSLTPEVADALTRGVSRTKEKQIKEIANVLVKALAKGGVAAGAAGRMMIRHASKKEHVQAILDAYAKDENRNDEKVKDGLLEGLCRILDEPKLRKVESFQKALDKWKPK